VQDPIRDEAAREISLGPDPLSAALRSDLRERLERIIREELWAALGADRYERTPERRGYQHSPRERTLTTAEGTTTITVPRGRLFKPGGGSEEWQSQLLPRYARRTREVDAALIGLYLSGTNTRRVKLALRPLLKGAPLSKSTVSRVVAGLQDQYETWRSRDLSGEALKMLYLDAVWLRVRLAKKIEKLPVAVAVGVREDGTKVLLGLWVYASEGRAAWGGVLEDLAARGLPIPALVVIDGSKGLRGAVSECWPHRSGCTRSSGRTTARSSTPKTSGRRGGRGSSSRRNGRSGARRWSRASTRPATSCSRSTASRKASGRGCAPPTSSSV